MKKTNFFNEIIRGVPKRKINAVLKENGISPAHTAEKARHKLNKLISRGGDEALYAVADLHPDRDLILRAHDHQKKKKGSHYFCACGGCANYHKAEGDDKAGISEQINAFVRKNAGIMTLVSLTLSMVIVVQIARGK